ncbi:MAG TPA: hypothetical protein VNL98_06765 [Gemmatimonadales bacterium]|nr:hypothetical protein [Gemmatimonadales bacterium]
MTTPSEPVPVPVALCREAEQPDRPCRFADRCHESRQQVQHRYGLRGERCWAFAQFLARQQSAEESAA